MENLADLLRNAHAFSPTPGDALLPREQVIQIHRQAQRQFSSMRSALPFSSSIALHDQHSKACLIPLEKMTPIHLSDFDIDKTHVGCYVVLKIIEEPFRTSAIQCVVEDLKGNVSLLSFYNFKTFPPVGLQFILKEPYYKMSMSGLPAIRVEDKRNIITLNDVEFKVPEWNLSLDSAKPGTDGTNTASDNGSGAGYSNQDEGEQLRKEGNKLFAKKKYGKAIKLYTAAIESSPLNRHLAYSNRAAAHLLLKDYEDALKDATEALRIDDKHSKSMYRKGKALVMLERFDEATGILNEAKALDKDSDEINTLLKAAAKRVKPSQ
ncbi:hypothetical protein BKA69DRAFT_1125952 [Paraphysoderma sedebokerense]|nr:hypothetical protein BKA69DRAFT_1125952 [Paraphysoderma sedebokerense]